MMNIPDLCGDKSTCCGCGVCAALCPKRVIKMQADIEGFIYPVIDDTKCIKCEKCITFCIFKKNLGLEITK